MTITEGIKKYSQELKELAEFYENLDLSKYDPDERRSLAQDLAKATNELSIDRYNIFVK